MRLDRRTLIALGTLSGIPMLTGASINQLPKGAGFRHGVASGDPLEDRIIIWSRLSGVNRPTNVLWQVALDERFTDIVAFGTVMAEAGRDYTLKVDVPRLSADTNYVYRFVADGIVSDVGHTRTLPKTTDKIVLAVASCALHPNGYFNAYRAIADLERVDAVVHLGDYIYEYGGDIADYGMGNGRDLGRIPEPLHEIVSLNDYRARHAQYKRDADLQAAHARAAWICVFDDHEICNNPWKSGAQGHIEVKEDGRFASRKAAALKAYLEWMPVREPEPKQLCEAIYRSFRFGDLAELIMVETRLIARSKQLDYAKDLPLVRGDDGVERPDYVTFRNFLNDPARELLGARQRQWLSAKLQASVTDGVRWQLLGNQIVMARIAGPDIEKAFGRETVAGCLQGLPALAQTQLQTILDAFGQSDPLPLNLDAWDGYPAERERLYTMIKEAGAHTVVLSGDSHCAWANQLHDQDGLPVAVELGITAISSPTKAYADLLPNIDLAEILSAQNAEVLAADDRSNGFVRLTLTSDEVVGEWMSIDTIKSRDFMCTSSARFIARAAPGQAPVLTKEA